MKRRWMVAFLLLAVIAAGSASAGEVQWVRATVLLEDSSGGLQRDRGSLIPGGIYSLAEVTRRGIDNVDAEILKRVRFLGGEMDDAEQAMRLGDLIPRQYYLSLEVGVPVSVPVIDLNPRLGIVLELQRIEGNEMVCNVQFLEPEGPAGVVEYTGEPITLRLQEANLEDVIDTFGMVTQKEIMLDGEVDGKVTVDLRKVPWDQAFDVILRTNNLGWEDDGDALRVFPLAELNQRRRVRSTAIIRLPRDGGGAATVASRGDEETQMVVVVIESVASKPELVAERDGLLRPPPMEISGLPIDDTRPDAAGLIVFRGTATATGDLEDVKILGSPFPDAQEDLLQLLRSVRWTILDEQVRRVDAVVGYGLRIKRAPTGPPGLVPIAAVERVGVDVTAEAAGPDHRDQYVISVVVRDLETGNIISAPRITAAVGREATIKSDFTGNRGAPASFAMRITIAEDGRRVDYSWTITANGQVLSSHSAQLEL
jgi:hypothetical protein